MGTQPEKTSLRLSRCCGYDVVAVIVTNGHVSTAPSISQMIISMKEIYRKTSRTQGIKYGRQSPMCPRLLIMSVCTVTFEPTVIRGPNACTRYATSTIFFGDFDNAWEVKCRPLNGQLQLRCKLGVTRLTPPYLHG